MPQKNINFEQSLDEINQLVNKMEQGNLPLEDSLKHFETGIKRIRECQQALTQAEQTVKILTEGNEKLEPFSDDEH